MKENELQKIQSHTATINTFILTFFEWHGKMCILFESIDWENLIFTVKCISQFS